MAALGLCHQGTGLFQQFGGSTLVKAQPCPVRCQIFPVKEANIPIHILNTNHPEDPGTIIQERTNIKNPYAITGIAGKEGFVSIYIYKKHMSSEVGYIRKVLSILEMYNVSVEHIPSGIDSFSVVVNKSDVQDSFI